MEVLLWIILMTFLIGAVSLVGAVTLWIKGKFLQRVLFMLVAFSAGALLSGAFFHLLAESLGKISIIRAFVYVFMGFILFFIAERFLHWRHCHNGVCDIHAFSYLILWGDGFHNFIDGLIIAASFLTSVPFGIITTLLIISHEIPQELGDFGVMVYGGLTKTKALLYNLISQMTAVIGGIVGYALSGEVEATIPFMLPFAAGGFIYIAASDLIPELHKESDIKKSASSLIFFIVGVLFMFLIKVLLGG